jgi:hypothetical protein
MKTHKTSPDRQAQSQKPAPRIVHDPEREREQQALNRHPDKLVGDTAENRNLTGSTTWETLPEPQGSKRQPKGRSGH